MNGRGVICAGVCALLAQGAWGTSQDQQNWLSPYDSSQDSGQVPQSRGGLPDAGFQSLMSLVDQRFGQLTQKQEAMESSLRKEIRELSARLDSVERSLLAACFSEPEEPSQQKVTLPETQDLPPQQMAQTRVSQRQEPNKTPGKSHKRFNVA